MKIVCGLGSIDEYIRLAKAGADEFFCGYVPFDWIEKYGVLSPLNRREVLYYNVQISAFSDMVILSQMVKVYQIPVKITFNSLFYTPEQYKVVASYITQCMEIGFDTFIIADVAFIQYLRKQKINCKIHLSGETAEVNRAMIDFFNTFDITRYVFHRKNTLEDMKSCIVNNPVKDLEYEAFILNEMCHFTGGFCNSLHCDELTHMCKVPYEMALVDQECKRFPAVLHNFEMEKQEIKSLDAAEQIPDDHEFDSSMNEDESGNEDEDISYVTGSTGCGLCALWGLQNAGVTHLKLVGRGNYVDYMEQDVLSLKKALAILSECKEESEFKRRVKEELFTGKCSGQCYYR